MNAFRRLLPGVRNRACRWDDHKATFAFGSVLRVLVNG